jgi:hypothetical protein
VGEERLKAELIDGDVTTGGDTGLDCGAGLDGIDRSSRSFIPDDEAGAAAGLGALAAGDVKDENSPKPLVEPVV